MGFLRRETGTNLFESVKKMILIIQEALYGHIRHRGSKGETSILRRDRYVKATRTTLTSGVNTILFGVTTFFSVALAVRYLGTERYGLWLTIFTFMAWLNLSDFGIGNALTNKLAEACGRNQVREAQDFVASAFWLFLLIGIIILIAGLFVGFALPWTNLLNIKSSKASHELPLSIAVAFGIYGLSFPLTITRNIYFGYQEGYLANLWGIAGNLLSLMALFIATRFQGGLTLLITAVFGAQLVTQLINALFLFGFHRRQLIPYFHCVKKFNVNVLFQLGLMFVVLQLAAVVIYQADNIVIIRYLGPSSVALFGTAWKLFGYVRNLQAWILNPLWPAYGEAYARKDFIWIRKTLRFSLLGVMFLSVLISGGLTILGREIVRLWVGSDLVPTFNLIIPMALMQLMWAWTEPFVVFLNGISRLRGQMLYGLGTALLSLFLKIVFVSHFGLNGIIAATLVAYILLAGWLLPLDAWRVITKWTAFCSFPREKVAMV